MPKVLALGSSFMNSLKLSEEYARSRYGFEVDFCITSMEAWLASPLVLRDAGFQFEQDPQVIYADHAPVPPFVRQLPGNQAPSSYDMLLVGHVGMRPRSDFLLANRLPGATEHLWRNPVTWTLFESVVDPVRGKLPPNTYPTWGGGKMHRSTFSMSLKETLLTVSRHSPSTQRRYYLSTHPAFLSGESASPRDLEKVALLEYWDVIRKICAEAGFVFVPPPREALDPSGTFTLPEYSINAASLDRHLNGEYGRHVWDSLQSYG